MKRSKLFGIVAVAAIMLSLVPQSGFARDIISVDNTLFSDDFEGYAEGDVPGNVIISGFNEVAAPSLAVVQTEGDKAMNISCDAASVSEAIGEIAYQRRFGVSGGSWKMNIKNIGGTGSLGIGFRGTSSSQKLFPLMIKSGEFVNGITGTHLMDCEAGREYQVEFTYDALSGMLGIFIDGSEITVLDWKNTENAADLSAETTTLRISFAGDVSAEAVTSFLIDDFILTEPVMKIEDFAYFDNEGNEFTELVGTTIAAKARITSFEAETKRLGIFTRVSDGLEVVSITYAEYEADQATGEVEIWFNIPDKSGDYEAETILVLPDDGYRPIAKSINLN